MSEVGSFQRLFADRFSPLPEGWRAVQIESLVRERTEVSNDLSKFPLCSFTIEDGVTDKTSRYERSFLLKDKENNEYCVVREGDFVLNPMNLRFGAIGRSNKTYPVSVSAYYNVFYLTCDDCDPTFLEYLLKTPELRHIYERVATGSLLEKKRVHFSDFRRIPIPLPPIHEQREIVSTLSMCDSAIKLTEKLISRKQVRKSAFLRSMLTGKLRFPEFEHRPWNNKPLKDIGTFSKGAGIPKSDLVENGVPAIRYGELYTTHHTVIRSINSYISEATAKGSRRVFKGDLLFAGSGESAKEIGKVAVYLSDGPAFASGDIIILTPKHGDPLYLAYALNAPHALRYRERHGKGQSVVHIYKSDLENYSCPFPEPEEQRQIAAFFDDLDCEIILLSKRVSFLRKLRTGLVQTFMSGRMRVAVADPAEG